MGEWLSDRLEALQELQDEWNESEEGQAIAALGEALGDGEISLPPRVNPEVKGPFYRRSEDETYLQTPAPVGCMPRPLHLQLCIHTCQSLPFQHWQ